ncbi:MAG: membrane protein [Candidatus Velthaea sp.]
MEATVRLSLDAVVVAIDEETPRVLTLRGSPPRLPSGPLDIRGDRTLELCARRLIGDQGGLRVGYLEQLYTFGDRDRGSVEADARVVSIGYLALVGSSVAAAAPPGSDWSDWYRHFPWEDRRAGATSAHASVTSFVTAALAERNDPALHARACVTFGLNGSAWNGEAVLERYELLYELGGAERFGEPLALDHRRIVATSIGRIRGKIRYRPIVFELLPDTFTLSDLQRTVEALAGVRLHTPNFRRLVSDTRIVERTGGRRITAGRPADMFRFRPDVLAERPDPGIAIP